MLKDIMEGAAILETFPAAGEDGWQAQGRCARSEDPELWFAPAEDESPRYAHIESRKARQIARAKDRNRAKEKCRACPVRAICLRQAMDTEDGDYGMWGALDQTERTKLKNMLAAKDAVA